MPVQIYVGNLTYSMTEDSLRELFAPFGEVLSTKIIKDRLTDRSRGFGFVEMENKDEAESAIQKIDGTEVEGRNMKVNLARPRKE